MKITAEYCRKRFLRDFARMTHTRQSALIEAFTAMRDSHEADPESEPVEPEQASLIETPETGGADAAA